GETPREGDTFYLAHEEAFAKEGADVTLHATVRALPPPRLVWEGFDPELQRWHPIVVESDETGSFTKSGSTKISAPKNGLTTVNGVRPSGYGYAWPRGATTFRQASSPF